MAWLFVYLIEETVMVDLKEIKDLVTDQGDAWVSFQAKNKAHPRPS